MGITELTKELIKRPSFDDGCLYESPVTEYLFAYMKEQFPWLNITLQEVAPNRYNIFATDGAPCSVLVINQLDTVQPSRSWTRDPLSPHEEDGKIFGLGASDSKGNIAAFLDALKQHGKTRGLSILWYVDEEYHFAGMKHFITSPLAQSIAPQFVLSVDGSGNAFGRGCRGLIEWNLTLKSTSEHSARFTKKPLFQIFTSFVEGLQEKVASAKNDFFGVSTMNIARLEMGSRDREGKFLSIGNRTPEELTACIEMRTVPGISWQDVEAVFLNSPLHDVTLEVQCNEDLSAFETSLKKLQPMVSLLDTDKRLDPKQFGYLDLALMQSVYPDAALCSYGAGTPGQAHAPDEYVYIADLEEAARYYQQVLSSLCPT